MSLEVLGYRVLIKPEELVEETDSGIIIQMNERIEKAARETGTIISIGPSAWKEYGNGEPWAEVGDRVLFSRYGGKMIIDSETYDDLGGGDEYYVVADNDVLCRIEENN